MEDRKMTARLYEASQAGVQVDLCVRGFCCLKPGVPGLSENIRVVSVIGRFLEHSRIFHFSGGQSDPLKGHWYMGSADWMYRNLNNRLEAICPIYDKAARRRLHEAMRANLDDQAQAWDLQPDGSYVRRERTGRGTFVTMMRSTQKAHAAALAALLELVQAAHRAGADAIKLQLFTADELLAGAATLAEYQKDAGERDPRDMLRRLELPLDAARRATDLSHELGMHAISTVFDLPLLPIADELPLDAYKTASPDLV
ncbi:Polyphosphate kinase (ATP-polyphosphate phosphotransferase) (Polyphosphoric acid kinase), partial [Durusdinium trenchii]